MADPPRSAPPFDRLAFSQLRHPHQPSGRHVRPRRRRPSRWGQGLVGVALAGAGALLLLGLMLLPERLDALLLVSTAIANVIGGLSRLGLGLLQLAGVLVVALLAFLALALLLGGMLRLMRALLAPVSGAGAVPKGPRVARRTRGIGEGIPIAARGALGFRGRP